MKALNLLAAPRHRPLWVGEHRPLAGSRNGPLVGQMDCFRNSTDAIELCKKQAPHRSNRE
jgi:hypothetical protein